jgi:hypothetical protein
MINDYVVVKPADVIDVSFEVSALMESGTQVNVITNIINLISNEFSKQNIDLGQSYIMGSLIKKISQIDGLISLNYIKAFNRVGGNYSSSRLSDDLLINIDTGEIDLTSGLIRVTTDQILQIKSPEIDIVVIPTTQNLLAL